MTALVEAGAFAFDISGVTLNGATIPFRVIEAIGFVVFVVLVFWSIWELNNKVHTDQRQLTINVTPSHLRGTDDILASFFPHTDGTSLVAVGFLNITVRNAANHEIRIREMYVEAYRKNIWWRPETAQLRFVVWGDNLEWHDNPHRERVEWIIPAQSPALEINTQFQDDIPDGIGKEYKLRLVAIIGKPDRRIKVPFYL